MDMAGIISVMGFSRGYYRRGGGYGEDNNRHQHHYHRKKVVENNLIRVGVGIGGINASTFSGVLS